MNSLISAPLNEDYIITSIFTRETEAQRGNLLVGSRAGLESDQPTRSQALVLAALGGHRVGAPGWPRGRVLDPEAELGAEASSRCFPSLQPWVVAEPKFWFLFSTCRAKASTWLSLCDNKM